MFDEERAAYDGQNLRFEISSMLPDNGTMLEYDMFAVSKRNDNIPFVLSDYFDPAKTSMDILPWLAWQYSIDLWDTTWSEEKKRAIVLKAHYLHSLKGTATGIGEHIRFAGGELRKVVAPPIQAFAGRNYTQAERDAWLAPMPQFRLYRFRTNSVGYGKTFTIEDVRNRKRKMFAGRHDKTGWGYRACLPLTSAQERIGTRGFLYDPLDKSLIPVKTVTVQKSTESADAVDIFQVARKGNAGLGLFPGAKRKTFIPGDKSRGCIATGHKQSGGFYTLRVPDAYQYTASSLHLNTVEPSLNPVDTRYKFVQEHGKAQFGGFFPRGASPKDGHKTLLRKAYLPPSTARMRLYQQIHLFDPDRFTSIRKARSFAGHLRLGIPAYTAELSILVKGKRLRNSFGDFVRGFLHKSDHKQLDASLRAVRISKAARDKTLVRIGLRQIPQLGTGLPLDTDYRFGDRLLE